MIDIEKYILGLKTTWIRRGQYRGSPPNPKINRQRYLKCSVPFAHGKGTELSGTPETILVVTAPRGKGAKASGEMTITLVKQMCTRVRAATPTKDRH